ncbi:hypothetical protein KGQ20_14340 [Catenulispora sp. NF23]|uniref:hypothetical protein n=1 Tax=Catenulispora pinistramenti TaxID=2705254 RepID=UPI001BABFADD|nr:hypothetical protein [Catenulispora pinistramenti]MBS2533950.1 hypothetical protein [Catenulispora pinistramenti]
MDRSSLTEQYLDRLRRASATASELIGRQPSLPASYYPDGLLPRPLFLGRQELDRVVADLENFRAALVSLPDKVFGGDLAAFARAAGMTERQIAAVLRGPRGALSRICRVDLYLSDTGFKVLEANMSSSLGGFDNVEVCRMLLEHPVLAEFADQHGLGYTDTMSELLHSMFVETGFDPGGAGPAPVVAVADTLTSFTGRYGPFNREFAEHLRGLGIDAEACHVGQFDYHDDRVWLDGRAVDIVLRFFIAEDLLESPDAAGLIEQVLDAAAADQVKLFSALDVEVFASKAALAMLSDEANRHLFTEQERASLDRILPWTRMLRPGTVSLEDGSRVDLIGYAFTHQREFALKPAGSYGGKGVVLGWEEAVTPDIWRDRVTAAVGGPFVLQRRIQPVTELFPDEDGELRPWVVVWGMFSAVNGFAGVQVRGVALDAETGVVCVANGARATSVLHEAGVS